MIFQPQFGEELCQIIQETYMNFLMLKKLLQVLISFPAFAVKAVVAVPTDAIMHDVRELIL